MKSKSVLIRRSRKRSEQREFWSRKQTFKRSFFALKLNYRS